METTIPHMDWGDPDCCGCLTVVVQEYLAHLVCNECSLVVRTVSKANLHVVLSEMSLAHGLACEMCPHCGAVNLFPGFTEMKAFVCRECGKGVTITP